MAYAQTETRKEATVVFVKSVKSNVKKGADTELGRLTLIVGPNGTGKSSIVNAVELALTGRASDVVGRVEVAKGIDLLALAPAGDDALWAKATLSDGQSVEWRCERNAKTGGAREATHTLPASVKPSFPVRQVREALSGSPATVRAWLVGRIGAAVSENAILNLFPEDLRAAYSDLCRPLFGTPAQTLLDAREAAGKQARNAAADAKAATALAEQTGASLAVEPTEAEVEVARRRVREAAVAASATVKARVPYDLPRLRADAEEKVAVYARLSEQAGALEAKLSEAKPINAEVARTRDALTRVLTFTAQHHAEECLVCTSPIRYGDHATMLTRAEALVNATQADIATMQAQAERERIERALADALREAQDAVARFRAAEVAMAEADAQPTDGDAHARLREAEDIVRGLESTRAQWEDVRAAQARARDAKGRARLYADLHDAIEDAIGRVLERARVDFVTKVRSYLPVEDAFDLALSVNGKDVCQFGFVRDGILHTALSGAEWARLTLALAAAVASDDEADLSVLTPEDRAFDPETLAAVLRGMSNAPGQVILCSPVAPAGRVPKGWTVIDLSPPKAPRAKKTDTEADAAMEAK
jgi:energy-coupling factor transporter ATP-binding protein EcfA2